MIFDFSFEVALEISEEAVSGDIISLSALLKKEDNLIKLLPCTEEEFEAGKKYLEKEILEEKGQRLESRHLAKKRRKEEKEYRKDKILSLTNVINEYKEKGYDNKYIDEWTAELKEVRNQKLEVDTFFDRMAQRASKNIGKLNKTYHVFFEGGYENLRENILEEIRKNREEIKKQLSL